MDTKNCVGKWVVNTGNSGRRGWVGQIVSESMYHFIIRWVNDENGFRIDASKHHDLKGDCTRQYSYQFVVNSLAEVIGQVPNPKPTETYIIWSPQGNRNPSVTHRTKDEAIKAAKEMATRYRGQTFNVCKVVGKATEVPNVVYEEL